MNYKKDLDERSGSFSPVSPASSFFKYILGSLGKTGSHSLKPFEEDTDVLQMAFMKGEPGRVI